MYFGLESDSIVNGAEATHIESELRPVEWAITYISPPDCRFCKLIAYSISFRTIKTSQNHENWLWIRQWSVHWSCLYMFLRIWSFQPDSIITHRQKIARELPRYNHFFAVGWCARNRNSAIAFTKYRTTNLRLGSITQILCLIRIHRYWP